MINKKRLAFLTRQLIRINSENPPGNESRIATFIKDYLLGLDLKVRFCEFRKNRTNLIAVLKGRNNKRSLLLTPHLDTVPAGKNWKISPFSAKLINNRIYGLGATDCKGNLACAIETINSLIEDGAILDYDLIFAATADEETGSSLGLIPLLNKGIIKADAAVILDSDNFNIIITQKGLMHLKVKIQGRRAHGAYPWRGINAIDIAVDIIKEIKCFKFDYKPNKYLRPPTVNIGTIRGGDKVNVVADWCEFEMDFRFLAGMSTKHILEQIKRIIKRSAKKFFPKSRMPQNALKIEIQAIQEPYCISRTHSLVTNLIRAMKAEKIKGEVRGSEGATVITFFQHKNIPAVATGFGSSGCAHTADEYVNINNLYKGALVLENFLKNYRGD